MELHRTHNLTHACLGDLNVDGEFFCHTLEDLVRWGKKEAGETAIPSGQYGIIIDMSPKFGKLMPRLLGVPHFTGILMHKGNTHEDTRGCILVGDKLDYEKGEIVGGTSTPAWERLWKKMLEADAAHQPITINITNDFSGGVANVLEG